MADQYKRGELFRRYHLVNIDNKVIKESSEVVDSALVESDNQSDLSVLDEVVVPVRTRKRKAASDDNIGKICEEGKPKKNPKVKSWSPERVELLLKYLKEYKVTCDFNGKDFEQYKHYKPHPSTQGLHVKARFFRTRVSGVPHLPAVPHLHVNRPLQITSNSFDLS